MEMHINNYETDYLKDGSTPIRNLVLAGDGIFPGIGVPAVAINGASAANSLVRYGRCVRVRTCV